MQRGDWPVQGAECTRCYRHIDMTCSSPQGKRAIGSYPWRCTLTVLIVPGNCRPVGWHPMTDTYSGYSCYIKLKDKPGDEKDSTHTPGVCLGPSDTDMAALVMVREMDRTNTRHTHNSKQRNNP